VKALRDVVPGLKTFLGADFPVAFHDYQSAKDDRAYEQWKITTDLSIKSEDGRPIFGLEVHHTQTLWTTRLVEAGAFL